MIPDGLCRNTCFTDLGTVEWNRSESEWQIRGAPLRKGTRKGDNVRIVDKAKGEHGFTEVGR